MDTGQQWHRLQGAASGLQGDTSVPGLQGRDQAASCRHMEGCPHCLSHTYTHVQEASAVPSEPLDSPMRGAFCPARRQKLGLVSTVPSAIAGFAGSCSTLNLRLVLSEGASTIPNLSLPLLAAVVLPAFCAAQACRVATAIRRFKHALRQMAATPQHAAPSKGTNEESAGGRRG